MQNITLAPHSQAQSETSGLPRFYADCLNVWAEHERNIFPFNVVSPSAGYSWQQ